MRNPKTRIGIVALILYGISIFLANWLIRTVGTPVSGGNHVVPVGFGLFAPSGAYAAGITFVSRDVVQRTIGKRWSLLVILPGALLSALLDVQLAVASAAAFLFSESVDFLIYTPLQQRGFVRAVVASGVAASVVDSLLFLSIAGIPLAIAFPGLLLAKIYVMIVAAPLAYALRLQLAKLDAPDRALAPAVSLADTAKS